jgi:hypothetical protein
MHKAIESLPYMAELLGPGVVGNVVKRVAMHGAEAVAKEAMIEAGRAALARGATTPVEGSAGSLPSFVARAASERLGAGGCVVLVVAHLDEADDAVEELRGLGIEAALFPALEVLPGETSPSADLTVARLAVVRKLAENDAPRVIVAPIAALMQAVPEPKRLPALVRDLRTGGRVAPTALVAWLVEGGYRRVESIESPGEVAVRGGIIDICPPGGGAPVRLDFFGDEIERMFEIDIATQASDRKVDQIELVAVALDAVLGDAKTGAGAQPLIFMTGPHEVEGGEEALKTAWLETQKAAPAAVAAPTSRLKSASLSQRHWPGARSSGRRSPPICERCRVSTRLPTAATMRLT